VPDIEFVPGASGESDGAEELGGGRRRRFPVWLVAAAIAVIAAFALVVILNHTVHTTAGSASSAGSSSSVPAPPSRSGPLASYTYTPPLPQGVGQPFQLGASSHVFDVALSRQGIWALTDHDLVLLLPDGRTVSRGLPAAELPPIYTSGAARLVVDQPANLIWVVVAGQNGGRVIGYRMARQDRVADVATPPINGAAAMGGRLYLTSDDRVLAVATTGSITRVARLPVTLGMVTADPARDRLLVLDHAHRASVWPISRSPSGRMQVGRPVRLLVYPTGLVVADGQIWVGGFDDGDGSLFRVDPARLRLLPHSVDRKAFGTGALPVAGGDSVVWVRDAQGTEMHCLDARTGRDLQDWSIDGPVASHTGLAVVASSAGLLPLRLSECRG
jgi:hypothetical protein